MEPITYANIEVEGFPFKKLLSLYIDHRPNEHGIATLEGEVEADTAKDLVQRVDEKKLVKITTSAEGQKNTTLFCGKVKDIALRQENEYGIISLSLYTTSRILDVKKKSKTYQQKKQTYKEIISDGISEEEGKLNMTVSDKAIEHLIMKYDETDWEFALRMASKLDAPLVADITAEKPYICVGLLPEKEVEQIDSKEFSYTSKVEDYTKMSGAMIQDFAGDQAKSYAYAYIGNTITINGSPTRIKGVHAVLVDGILHMTYDLMPAGGSVVGIAAPKMQSRAVGKMMKGIVKKVEGASLQVHLPDIDEEYDSKGDWFFQFSTPYSSSDGSGWYCMPEVDDIVRIFFPTGEEEYAFAASSECAQPPKNPRNKSWKAPGGKEILLTDEGMYIIGKSGKIYINLIDDKGVEIYSDKVINVMSDKQVNICAANQVQIVASNEIVIGTEDAYIDIDKSTAVLAAKKVLIN